MKHFPANPVGTTREHPAGDRARIRGTIALPACLLFVAGLSAILVSCTPKESARTDAQHQRALTESTRAVLNRLNAPVEIRFYALLDPAGVPVSLKAFADRVDAMLSDYEQEANGKIRVARHLSMSDSAANLASSDGIQPFNLEKGNACYLGLAVACNGRKLSIPRLSPEWEQAVEFDLSRAIAQVSSPIPPPPGADTSRPDASAIESVKQIIPNFASVSMEEGTRILREEGLKNFKAAVGEMEAQVGKARERLSQTQNGGSEVEQQAALKKLQELQKEQSDRTKEIAQRLQIQIIALKELKGQ